MYWKSVPQLDRAVPAACHNFARLNWVPVNVNSDAVFVDTHSPIILACLPVPEPQFSICVTWCQKLTIWTKLESTSVPRIHMTSKPLFSVQFEVAMLYIVDYDTIVHALPGKVFPVRMHSRWGHRMHIWLANVFGDNWYSKLPNEDFLVVRSRDKLFTVLNKR